ADPGGRVVVLGAHRRQLQSSKGIGGERIDKPCQQAMIRPPSVGYGRDPDGAVFCERRRGLRFATAERGKSVSAPAQWRNSEHRTSMKPLPLSVTLSRRS